MADRSENVEARPEAAGPSSLRGFVARLLLFATLWWTLNQGDGVSWVVGGPIVVLAAWAGTQLAPSRSWRLRPRGVLRFLPYFLATSLRGGVDVAWRAVHPRLPIDPALVRHPLRLPDGTARIFMVNVVSLLPGTLSAELDESTLVLHALNDAREAARGAAVLETRIADLFAVELSEPGEAR